MTVNSLIAGTINKTIRYITLKKRVPLFPLNRISYKFTRVFSASCWDCKANHKALSPTTFTARKMTLFL
jgi:hypothetical protein